MPGTANQGSLPMLSVWRDSMGLRHNCPPVWPLVSCPSWSWGLVAFLFQKNWYGESQAHTRDHSIRLSGDQSPQENKDTAVGQDILGPQDHFPLAKGRCFSLGKAIFFNTQTHACCVAQLSYIPSSGCLCCCSHFMCQAFAAFMSCFLNMDDLEIICKAHLS